MWTVSVGFCGKLYTKILVRRTMIILPKIQVRKVKTWRSKIGNFDCTFFFLFFFFNSATAGDEFLTQLSRLVNCNISSWPISWIFEKAFETSISCVEYVQNVACRQHFVKKNIKFGHWRRWSRVFNKPFGQFHGYSRYIFWGLRPTLNAIIYISLISVFTVVALHPDLTQHKIIISENQASQCLIYQI